MHHEQENRKRQTYSGACKAWQSSLFCANFPRLRHDELESVPTASSLEPVGKCLHDVFLSQKHKSVDPEGGLNVLAAWVQHKDATVRARAITTMNTRKSTAPEWQINPNQLTKYRTHVTKKSDESGKERTTALQELPTPKQQPRPKRSCIGSTQPESFVDFAWGYT